MIYWTSDAVAGTVLGNWDTSVCYIFDKWYSRKGCYNREEEDMATDNAIVIVAAGYWALTLVLHIQNLISFLYELYVVWIIVAILKLRKLKYREENSFAQTSQ